MKKKFNWKKILIIILVFFAIQGPLTWAIMTGKFSKGNKSEYSVANTEALPANALNGKTIIYLGSSVTYGSASGGESFAEYLEKRDGVTPVKEAVSGTTLVTDEKKNYIERMLTIDPNIKADAFICQLSTNDATKKKPLGEISSSTNLEDFDTGTVAGAIEYIIAYAQKTWNCPVFFYTGTKYDSDAYGEMVKLLLEIQKKWDITVIDLWNDPEMNAVSKEDYKLYMANGIHPTKAGYRDWWTPKFEEYLLNQFK